MTPKEEQKHTDLPEDDAFEIPPEILALHKRMDDEQKPIVRSLCDAMGYGRVMQLAADMWKEKDGLGGAFSVGPCTAFMIKCEHWIKDANGHCDLCCGAGEVTKGVSALARKADCHEELVALMTRAGITKYMLVQLANDAAVIVPTSNKDGWPICCIEYEDEYGDVPNLDFHVQCEEIRLNHPQTADRPARATNHQSEG